MSRNHRDAIDPFKDSDSESDFPTDNTIPEWQYHLMQGLNAIKRMSIQTQSDQMCQMVIKTLIQSTLETGVIIQQANLQEERQRQVLRQNQHSVNPQTQFLQLFRQLQNQPQVLSRDDSHLTDTLDFQEYQSEQPMVSTYGKTYSPEEFLQFDQTTYASPKEDATAKKEATTQLNTTEERRKLGKMHLVDANLTKLERKQLDTFIDNHCARSLMRLFFLNVHNMKNSSITLIGEAHQYFKDNPDERDEFWSFLENATQNTFEHTTLEKFKVDDVLMNRSFYYHRLTQPIKRGRRRRSNEEREIYE